MLLEKERTRAFSKFRAFVLARAWGVIENERLIIASVDLNSSAVRWAVNSGRETRAVELLKRHRETLCHQRVLG